MNGDELDRIITGNREGDPTWYPGCEQARMEEKALDDARRAYEQVVEEPCSVCGKINRYQPAYEVVGDPMGCPVCTAWMEEEVYEEEETR